MPLLRQSLYCQNVNLYLAPTADGKDTWLPLMRTIACEGRCVVLSANQCMRKSSLPSWITGKKELGSISEDSHRVNDHTQATTMLRRKSLATEDGNEIVLPGTKENDLALTGSDMSQEIESFSRRKSVVIENGHEIVLPALKEESTSAVPVNDVSTIPALLRRKSTITIDGNEIVLPPVEGSDSDSTPPHTKQTKADPSELISRGGSCIISPLGNVLAGPLWDDENGMLIAEVDFEDCLRGRLDLDVGGSYSRYVLTLLNIRLRADYMPRNDAFKLSVEGLDLSPPP